VISSPLQIGHGALAFVDQYVRVTTGFEVAALVTLALAQARAAFVSAKQPCDSRS
jgi:hypothetical protein